VIYEIVPVVRTVDDHIDNWDAVADFVMKSLSKNDPKGA
jgi:hypothetical protein